MFEFCYLRVGCVIDYCLNVYSKGPNTQMWHCVWRLVCAWNVQDGHKVTLQVHNDMIKATISTDRLGLTGPHFLANLFITPHVVSCFRSGYFRNCVTGVLNKRAIYRKTMQRNIVLPHFEIIIVTYSVNDGLDEDLVWDSPLKAQIWQHAVFPFREKISQPRLTNFQYQKNRY
jgi:hypothetical protein